MMSLPLAHIGGIPVEETLASIIPALLLTIGAASATVRARLRRARSRRRGTAPRKATGSA
jgi:hypothetical protein